MQKPELRNVKLQMQNTWQYFSTHYLRTLFRILRDPHPFYVKNSQLGLGERGNQWLVALAFLFQAVTAAKLFNATSQGVLPSYANEFQMWHGPAQGVLTVEAEWLPPVCLMDWLRPPRSQTHWFLLIYLIIVTSP